MGEATERAHTGFYSFLRKYCVCNASLYIGHIKARKSRGAAILFLTCSLFKALFTIYIWTTAKEDKNITVNDVQTDSLKPFEKPLIRSNFRMDRTRKIGTEF